MEQIKLDLTEVKTINNKDIDEDVLNSSADEVEEEANLLYKKRLKKLIKDIADFEEFGGIQAGEKTMIRIQETSKFLTSMLIIEAIEEVRSTNRKKIMPNDIDNALDRILSKATGIDTALDMLNKNIEELKSLNKNTSVNKTSSFINR